MNREMLKEAIAEAKTIKETAIANAKAALEEAFTPQLTAMFAEKLNEEEEEEQNESYSLDKEELEETFNLDEILAELDGLNEEDEELKETKDKSEEDLMLEEMSDEEIEELILKVLRQEIESGNIEAGENFEEEESEEGDMEDMGAEEEESEEEEVEIDELLAEILAEEEEEELKELELPRIGVDKAEYESMLKDAGITDPNMIQKLWYKFLALTTKNKKGETVSTGAGSFTGGGGSTYRTDETKEMEETIAELRSELNEVNLLNAKLLYTNKIFKAKNLTESEKVKVLNTFDKAETVKEVKLVFETLTESLKTSTAKKSPIKESLGSASRTVSAPVETKQPIIEVNDAFARMQRLAGLRK
jgi:hypothetical protein